MKTAVSHRSGPVRLTAAAALATPSRKQALPKADFLACWHGIGVKFAGEARDWAQVPPDLRREY